jgi:hypothetical protein
MAEYKITTTNNLRRVEVKVGNFIKQGYFHCWGQFGGSEDYEVCGIIEYDDGNCNTHSVYNIRFLDTEEDNHENHQ